MKITRKELRVNYVEPFIYVTHKHLSRKQQAKILGVNHTQLSGYLNAAHVSDTTIKQFGEYFGVTVSNEDLKPQSSRISFGEPKSGLESKSKRTTKEDEKAVHYRRKIEEREEMKRLNAEYNY